MTKSTGSGNGLRNTVLALALFGAGVSFGYLTAKQEGESVEAYGSNQANPKPEKAVNTAAHSGWREHISFDPITDENESYLKSAISRTTNKKEQYEIRLGCTTLTLKGSKIKFYYLKRMIYRVDKHDPISLDVVGDAYTKDELLGGLADDHVAGGKNFKTLISYLRDSESMIIRDRPNEGDYDYTVRTKGVHQQWLNMCARKPY